MNIIKLFFLAAGLLVNTPDRKMAPCIMSLRRLYRQRVLHRSAQTHVLRGENGGHTLSHPGEEEIIAFVQDPASGKILAATKTSIRS